MIKYKYFAIVLLLVGCTFDFKTDYEDLPASYRLETCQELKEKSYDVFYSNENLQCLDGFDLNRIEQNVEYIKTDRIGTSSGDKTVEQYLTMAKCKGGQNFTLENIRVNPIIYDYYSSAYRHCKDTGLFDAEKVRILERYYYFYSKLPYHLEDIGSFFISEEWERIERKKFERQKRLLDYENAAKIRIAKKKEEEKKNEEEYKKVLAELEQDPLMRKLKAAAPDFYDLPISGITFSVFMFIRQLQQRGSNVNSDLLFEKNYTFKKKDKDTLVIKIDNEPFCTMLKQNKEVIITELLGSKDIRRNTSVAWAICMGFVGL